METVTREDAARIAIESLRRQLVMAAARVREVTTIEELAAAGRRPPVVYLADGPVIEEGWIVYVGPSDGRVGLRSGYIVLVSRTTGEVYYSGSAHDEG